MRHPIVLGLDIGGSKTQALVTRADDVLLDQVFGSANIESVGEEAAARVLDEVADAVRSWNLDSVCAGAAGADTEADCEHTADLLRARFSDATVRVVHDSRLPLAALHLDSGVVVISGTGSVAWARNDMGEEARAGGWGYLLGDEGSGYGIARDAVRHVLAEADAGTPRGPLSEALLKTLGLDGRAQLLPAFYAQPERAVWARLAVPVLNLAAAGESGALAIRDAAVARLAKLVVTVAHRLEVDGPVVLAGGLLVNRPDLAASLTLALRGHELTDVRSLPHDPVWGAVHLAQDLVRTHSTTTHITYEES